MLSWFYIFILSSEGAGAIFDPLGIDSDKLSGFNETWQSVLGLFSQTFESTSSTRKEKPSSSRGVAGLLITLYI